MKQEFFPKNQEGKYEGATDSLYQSTFLPIFAKAEVEIKKMIVDSFWLFSSERVLREKINKYIKEISKKIPKNLKDRDAYINGLRAKSDKMIREQYRRALTKFVAITALIATNTEKEGLRPVKVSTPKQLMNAIQKKELKLNMWAEAKAAVRVENYPKEIKNYITRMTNETITTKEPGKHPISLWQKAELDIRHDKQMAMIQEFKDSGDEFAWISSHPDCSKRCERFQGELVSLKQSAGGGQTEKSPKSAFYLKTVDGHKVYSLPDIIAVVDKYGYNNNILVGFNCRHYLIKYKPGQKPPTEYSAKDVKRMREINSNCRAMERQIRDYKTQEKLYNEIGNKKMAAHYKYEAEQLTRAYKQYCNKNGFAWYEYRIKI